MVKFVVGSDLSEADKKISKETDKLFDKLVEKSGKDAGELMKVVAVKAMQELLGKNPEDAYKIEDMLLREGIISWPELIKVRRDVIKKML